MKYGVSFVATVYAWDVTNNVPKTGDAANITLQWLKDGVLAQTTNACAEVSNTLIKGVYKVTITAAEAAAFAATLGGNSTTAGVYIRPVSYSFESSPVIDRGTAQAIPDATHIQIAAAATFATGEIVGATVEIISATTGAGQSRVITAYDGTTNTATIDPAWITSPTGTVVYAIFATGPQPTTVPPTVNATKIGGTTQTAGDIYGSLTGAQAEAAVPAANASVLAKIGWIFARHRNKHTSDGSSVLVRNDADSGTLGTATESDAAGTTTRGKFT